MAIALPSKKIQALIIVVAALFLAYLVSTLNVRSWFSSTDGKGLLGSSLESVNASNGQSDIDSDNDGLRDWQESLWGTDKNNNDTDGDGAKDGEEIEKGRDPGVAGPDDSLEKTRGISAASVTAFSASVSTDPNNVSTSVSRDLFAKFMSLQSSGNLNDSSQAELVSSVIDDINPGSIPPRYAITDVRIADTNKASLKAYGNESARIIMFLQSAASRNAPNESVLAAYTGAIEKLKALPAPGTLGLTHLQILNNFNASHQMLLILVDYQNDPVKGLVALRSLQTNTDNAAELFTSVASELKNNGILFDSTEAGYIWNNYR
jgi:hypothetical protein